MISYEEWDDSNTGHLTQETGINVHITHVNLFICFYFLPLLLCLLH